jgi:cell division protein FtsQ
VAAPTFNLPRARPLPSPRALRLGLLRHPARIVAAAAAVAALVLGWHWLRDSPVVSVDQVEITGIHGPQARAIRSALTAAAHDQTTLHVDRKALRAAVANYPIVRDVRADAHPLHRLDLRVIAYTPVAVVVVAGRKVPVASDGTLLDGATAKHVPVLPLRHAPAGARITAGTERDLVAVAAAAPAALRDEVAKVFMGPKGLTARLRTGTGLHFGDATRLRAKWAAAAAVLADPSSKGTTALDLRVPERPAAAGLEQASQQQGVDQTDLSAGTATQPLATQPTTDQTTSVTPTP